MSQTSLPQTASDAAAAPAQPAGPSTRVPLSLGKPYRARGFKPPRHWMDLNPEQRVQAVTELGLPGYRAKQISSHWFSRLDADPASWSDLPAEVRERIGSEFLPQLMTPVQQLTADGGTTVKTAWRLGDGAIVESVLMRYPSRSTLCVSSEAGCGMNCPFCATGQGGLQRNLSTAEILDQVMAANRLLASGAVPRPRAGGHTTELGAEADLEQAAVDPASVPHAQPEAGQRLNNLVFMGMGEPMANYPAVIGAIHSLVAPQPDGLGMSARGITVSTVGMVPRMRSLIEEGLPLTLALSLHAPDDELRDELVPLNQHFNVDAVLDAAWDYANATKRRVSIEYALIKDINDQAWRADLLAKRLRQRGDWTWAHVNLIPLNPTPGSKWTASRRADQDAFVEHLERFKVPVTVRDTRGREIDGACGQLAAAVDARS